MKRLFKGIFTLLLVIIILVGGTVGVVASLVIDKTTLTNEKYESQDLDIGVSLNNLIYKALDDTSTEEKIDFVLDPEDLDYLVYAITSSLKKQISPFVITGTKVEFNDGIYYLKVSGGYQNIKSLVTLELDFKEENDTFIISINDLKLGKLGLNNALVHAFIDKIDVSQLEKSLKDFNVFCSIDIPSFSISITKYNLFNMVKSYLVDNPNFDLINIILDIYENDSSLYSFNTDDLLHFALNLNKFKYNGSINSLKNVIFIVTKQSVEELLNNEAIITTQANLAYFFILNGYNALNDEEKVKIEEIDFSSIGIEDVKNHLGLFLKTYTTLQDHITSLPIDYNFGDTSIKFNIEENILNQTLESNEFIGESYAFAHDDSNSTYANKVGYIVIEDLILELSENKIDLDLIIDINGYKIFIHADFIAHSHNGLIIEGTLDHFSIGEIELTSQQKNKVIKFLNKSIDEDWISISSSEDKITLDFTNQISNNSTIQTFINLFGDALITTSIKDDHIEITMGV